jgi:hypothetical protein
MNSRRAPVSRVGRQTGRLAHRPICDYSMEKETRKLKLKSSHTYLLRTQQVRRYKEKQVIASSFFPMPLSCYVRVVLLIEYGTPRTTGEVSNTTIPLSLRLHFTYITYITKLLTNTFRIQ